MTLATHNNGVYVMTIGKDNRKWDKWDGETYDSSWYVGHENDSDLYIRSAAQFASFITTASTTADTTGKTVHLTANLSFDDDYENNMSWITGVTSGHVPEGSLPKNRIHNAAQYKVFRGIFDGHFHAIRGLCWSHTSEWRKFIHMQPGSCIKNLVFENCVVCNTNSDMGYILSADMGSRVVKNFMCVNCKLILAGKNTLTSGFIAMYNNQSADGASQVTLRGCIADRHVVSYVNDPVYPQASGSHGMYTLRSERSDDTFDLACNMVLGLNVSCRRALPVSYWNKGYARDDKRSSWSSSTPSDKVITDKESTHISSYSWGDKFDEYDTRAAAIAEYNRRVLALKDAELSTLDDSGRYTGKNYLGELIQ